MTAASGHGVSLRQMLPDLDHVRHHHHHHHHDSHSSVDRKTSDATVIHRPSIASVPSDTMPWDGQGLPVAIKENDWLGFCPSAVKLQNGDRKSSLRKRTDYSASFAGAGLTTYYCSQKDCAFAGHTSVDFVFKTVMKDEKLGIKCRWPFLAKSHVRIKSVVGRAYQFQCPICIYTHGHADGRVWKGIDIFMEHVSTHRGKELSSEVLQKLHIINDRIAEDKDEFDINLVPPASRLATSPPPAVFNPRDSVSSVSTITPSPAAAPPHLSRTQTFSSFSFGSRKTSTALGLELSRTSTARSDRADSVFSCWTDAESIGSGSAPSCNGACVGGESWSEGLSQFNAEREEDYLSPDF